MDEIILGNSIEIVKNFPEESVHAIVSDIPYGIGYDEWDVLHNNQNLAYGGASSAQLEAGEIFKRRGKPLNGWSEADKKIPLEYQSWCASWAASWLKVLKPGGSCLILAGRRYAHRCIIAMEDAGFTFKDMLSWEKGTAPQRAQRLSAIYERRGDKINELRWAGWRVANLRPLFEPVLWFQKPYRTGGTLADNVLENEVGAWNEAALQKYNRQAEKKAVFSNTLKVEATPEDHGKHVAQKPLKLMELLIGLVTIEGQIVLDPFVGSGTTCVAARQLNRHYIGIDIDPQSVRTANERLEAPAQTQLALSH
jgi:site-specific DNA-methyltransferase (adenine-specific)